MNSAAKNKKKRQKWRPCMDSVFTDNSETRKNYPVHSLMMYFPKTFAALCELAVYGNLKHNPQIEPTAIKWTREKSDDHKECIGRHQIDGDWIELAMRAMMNAEVELENGFVPEFRKDMERLLLERDYPFNKPEDFEIEGSQYEPYEPNNDHTVRVRYITPDEQLKAPSNLVTGQIYTATLSIGGCYRINGRLYYNSHFEVVE
jgi:hypothetical protein